MKPSPAPSNLPAVIQSVDVMALMPTDCGRSNEARIMRDKIRSLCGGRGSTPAVLISNGRWRHVVDLGHTWAVKLADAFSDVRSERHGDEYQVMAMRTIGRAMLDGLASFPVQAGDSNWVEAHLWLARLEEVDPAHRLVDDAWRDLELTAMMIGTHAENLLEMLSACFDLSPEPIAPSRALLDADTAHIVLRLAGPPAPRGRRRVIHDLRQSELFAASA